MGIFGKDKICAVVAASDARGMWRQLREACRHSRTVELRLDWLASDAEIRRFLKQLGQRGAFWAPRPRPVLIATCRRRAAGGRYAGTIAQQLVYLALALHGGCAWFDLEIESASRCPRELIEVLLGEGRYLSSGHFFGGVPRNLESALAAISRPRPDAIKLAAQCDSLADAMKLLRLARPGARAGRNPVIVPMGDAALPARVLALRAGSAMAYAAIEQATAPGQPTVEQMRHRYRADRLAKAARVYGVIGDPIAQSLGPVMHNAAFQARRVNAVFLPFLVRDLRDFLGAIRPLGIAGFSVTLPHKQAIMRHLDHCDPLAAQIGAVNTVAIRNGKLHGSNTDYIGVLRTLERRLTLRGSRVLILGAGGAARSAAFALSKAGAIVCIWARRPARAKALARAAGAQATRRSALRTEFFDVIINATPAGMYPHPDESPLDPRELNCHLVFDAIYRPRETKLMKLAARRGIATVSGLEMFLAQGAAQWELWTGQRAPLEVMRRVVVRALAN